MKNIDSVTFLENYNDLNQSRNIAQNHIKTASFRGQQNNLPDILQPIPFTNSIKLKINPEKMFSKMKDHKKKQTVHLYDHIRSNMNIASNFNIYNEETSKFRTSTVNRTNKKNLEMLKQGKEEKQEVQMLQIIENNNRWRTFKIRRAEAINNFIDSKKL